MSLHPVLTQTVTEKTFTGTPGIDRKPIATSGVIGTAATLKLQYRVRETDAWVDYQGITFAAETHINGYFYLPAQFNRVYVDGATANTDVAVQL
tara:strand:+ start:1978 stop:2259 length:282 start_codon:yes stop_codon:yes gene_type:complete